MFPWSDIRFQYELAGGSMMDLGGYMILAIRSIFGTEALNCVSAEATLLPEGYDKKVDRAMKASWRFPNGGTGSVSVDLKAKGYPHLGGWLSKLVSWVPTIDWPGKAVAVHREVLVQDTTIAADQEHVVVKTVTMYNFLGPGIWHRISIVNIHTIRYVADKKVIMSWSEKRSERAHKEIERVKGEEWWSTYRYQLEVFVDRVKGREGSGVWMEGRDSVRQMEMIDSAYKKAGLPLRPTSELVGSEAPGV